MYCILPLDYTTPAQQVAQRCTTTCWQNIVILFSFYLTWPLFCIQDSWLYFSLFETISSGFPVTSFLVFCLTIQHLLISLQPFDCWCFLGLLWSTKPLGGKTQLIQLAAEAITTSPLSTPLGVFPNNNHGIKLETSIKKKETKETTIKLRQQQSAFISSRGILKNMYSGVHI